MGTVCCVSGYLYFRHSRYNPRSKPSKSCDGSISYEPYDKHRASIAQQTNKTSFTDHRVSYLFTDNAQNPHISPKIAIKKGYLSLKREIIEIIDICPLCDF